MIVVMERIGNLLWWNNSRPENRSLLPPREDKPWNCIFPSFQYERQENKDTPPCWSFFKWVGERAKRRAAPCYGNDQRPKSKVHPLSSKIIRRRNSHPPQRPEMEFKIQEADETFSCKAFKMNLCNGENDNQENEEALSNSKITCCPYHSKFKWRIGLSVLDIWPKSTCNLKTHTQNLKSIITSPSSWHWFQSSNSMFRDFLEDMEILKNMNAKDLNEYRELLLNESLTEDRLKNYSKIVLRVFVYLLRNQQPPKNFKKKVLIQLCTQWICKNKNYFCTFEKKANELFLNNSTSLKSLKNVKKWASMKESKVGNHSKDDLEGFDGSHNELKRSMSDSKNIKLVDELILEEKTQSVCDEDEEKCDGWCKHEDAESSSIFEGLQEPFCPCFTCINDDTFCYGCMCTICKETGTMQDSIFWLKCKECMHLSHLQCAIKVGFVGFNSIRKLDGEYWCQSCDIKEDLVPYWEAILKEASQCDSMPRLEILLYCAMSVMKDTKRPKIKDLQMLVCEAWNLIADGAQCSDIKILTNIICSNFESADNVQSNSVQGIDLQMHATNYLKKAEEDIASVQETIKEVEAWKNVLFQSEEQLKRLKSKLELKTKNAIFSKTAAIIAKKRLQNTGETEEVF